METVMSKYSLRFQDSQLELHYQSQVFEKQFKPLYYAALFLNLIMNFMQFMVRIISGSKLPIINLFLILASILTFIIIYKRASLAQISASLLNVCGLLLQLNFVDPDPTKQEYFAYGSMLATFQTCLFFFIDFQYSCPSIIIHNIFRLTASAYISETFNLTMLFLAFMCILFLTSAIYICNRAQRLQFLMNIKDETITQQLENFITAPFSKIIYDKEKLKFDVQLTKRIDQFITYTKDLCEACNVRTFLRDCKFNKKNLETGLLHKSLPLNQSISVSCMKTKLTIRICKFNINDSLIIIVEKSHSRCYNSTEIPIQLKKSLHLQLSLTYKAPLNQQFNYGIMSLIMMNNLNIKIVNITKSIKKLSSLYPFLENSIIKYNTEKDIKLKTYSQVFKIFLISLLNIISEMEIQQNHLEEITFTNYETCLLMQLKVNSIRPFIIYYNQNYFLQNTSSLLLLKPLNNYNLDFAFNKHFPFRY